MTHRLRSIVIITVISLSVITGIGVYYSSNSFSSSTVTAGAAVQPVEVDVIGHYLDSSVSLNLPLVDNQTIAKYPQVQSAIEIVEKKSEAIYILHKKYPMSTLTFAEPIDTVYVSPDMANSIIQEPSFKFKTDHKSHVANILVGNVEYIISISSQ